MNKNTTWSVVKTNQTGSLTQNIAFKKKYIYIYIISLNNEQTAFCVDKFE